MQYTIPPKLIRLPKVSIMSCLSKSSIYSFMNDGRFPKSISLGARSVAWLESDIQQWIDDRIKMRDQKAK